MKTAIVGDTCYFMGGYIGSGYNKYTNKVYSVSLYLSSTPVISLRYGRRYLNCQLQILLHSPSPDLCLQYVGGMDKGTYTSAILLHQPDTGEWMKVGDLPSPRCDCTCTMLTNRKFFVAGGNRGLGRLADY